MRGAFIAILFFITCTMQGQGLIIDSWRFAAAVAVDLLANNRSIDFDGSDEYVLVDDADNLSFTDGAGNDQPFSVSFWIYWPALGAAEPIFEKRDDGGSLIEWGLGGNNSNYFTFTVYNTGGFGNFIRHRGPTFTQPGEWYHITGTYDGSETTAGINIYQDGVLSNESKSTAGSYTGMSNTAATVNMAWNSVANYCAMKFDQVAIWDTVLSIDEIKEAMAIRDYNYHSRADNLVSWWEFDNDSIGTDNITDLIGTNHGTMTNGEYADLNVHVTWPYSYQLNNTAAYDSLTPMQSAGVSDNVFGGFSWDLDGSAEYIDCGAGNNLGIHGGDYSFSAWFKKTSADGTNQINLSINNDGINAGWKFDTALGKIRYNHASIGATPGPLTLNSIQTTETYNDDQWHHVVGTFAVGVGSKLYVDGEFYGSDNTTTSAITTFTQNLYIGRQDYVTYPRYYTGEMGDVIIFDKELTAAEVLEVYNNHEPRDETNTSLSGNLVGYWRGYNSTNTASGVLDQSGNANHGTPTSTDDADFQYAYPRELLDSTGSFDFDGVDEYILIPDADNLSFGDGTTDSPFSISYWVYHTLGVATGYVVKNNIGNDSIEYFLAIGATNDVFFDVKDESTGGRRGRSSSANVVAGWNHIVCTYNGDESNPMPGMRIYINGVRRDNADRSSGTYTAMENTNSDVAFQANNTGTSPLYYPGKMSHVSIFDKELSLAEVQELYNDGSPVDITAVTFSANVVSHWRIDQTDDPTGTVTDIVGSNNGTATNMEAGDLKTDLYPSN